MTKVGRLIAIEGPSAVGKTTLVTAASRTLRWRPLAEAFDRLDPVPSLEYASSTELALLEGTLLAEETRRYREGRRLCREGRTVLADTGFLGPVTYTHGLVDLDLAPVSVGRSIARGARALVERRVLGIPDLTVYLDSTLTEREQRARSGRGRHPVGLAHRHEAVGNVERTYFTKLFPDAFPHRFRVLGASSGPRALVSALQRIVEDVSPRPATRAEALAVLSQLPLFARGPRRRIVGPNR